MTWKRHWRAFVGRCWDLARRIGPRDDKLDQSTVDKCGFVRGLRASEGLSKEPDPVTGKRILLAAAFEPPRDHPYEVSVNVDDPLGVGRGLMFDDKANSGHGVALIPRTALRAHPQYPIGFDWDQDPHAWHGNLLLPNFDAVPEKLKRPLRVALLTFVAFECKHEPRPTT